MSLMNRYISCFPLLWQFGTCNASLSWVGNVHSPTSCSAADASDWFCFAQRFAPTTVRRIFSSCVFRELDPIRRLEVRVESNDVVVLLEVAATRSPLAVSPIAVVRLDWAIGSNAP